MNLNRLHLVVFWSFFFLFLVTSASVLFFTFGYRFSFDRGIFVYTGSITIKANPRLVTLFLDGKRVSDDMIHDINQSLHMTGLSPGEHFLRVEADGFQPWEKKIVIQSGISTEFWNILLPRISYERTMFSEGPYTKVFPSPTRKYFAIIGEKDGKTTLSVLERKTGTSEQVFSIQDLRFAAEDGRNVEWSKDEDSFLIPLRSPNQNEGSVYLVDRQSGTATNLADIAAIPNPENPRWHPNNDGTFFVFSRDTLFLVRPEIDAIEKRVVTVAKDISAYDLSGRYAAILGRGSGAVSLIPFGNMEGERNEPVLATIPGATDFDQPLINAYDEKRIAVYDRNGTGFLWNDDGKLEPSLIPFGNGIVGVQFSDDGKKLLFFTDNEISVVFTRDWDVQPARKNGEILQVVRFSSTISETQWSKDYEHVLFEQGGAIKIAELDNRDRRSIETLIQPFGRPLLQILPLPSENELYALSGKDDTGSASFFFVRFPEPVGIFGQ
ncbi:MAG: hypothetical protein HGB34_00680 [Candidatus Moranbacteria bacterium]|nr:hypothetical protein [Candidatus Moranbacteria bacterium]